MHRMIARFIAASVLASAVTMPAAAQESVQEEKKTDEDWRDWLPDPATLKMPELEFEASENDIKNYKKYYYFNRADTTFEEALIDVRECDELARGLAVGNYYPDAGTTAIYGVGGLVGGLIGGAISQAIYGSAEARAKRRVNMRRCMHFKGYARHGLAKDLWQEFNFEEGNSDVAEEDRQKMLAVQALVASSDGITAENIGL
ncbi:MAG: hypothetical protein AAGK17_03245 [Pseudomonadota bacterium]